MKSRQFFVSNSIQNFQAFTRKSPFQQKDFQKLGTSSSKRIKRVTSCHNSTSKLDPSKFINRQVFNSKLYPSKAFNIAVEFRKQKQNESNQYFLFNQNESFVSLKKKLQSKENGQEFTSGMTNVSHHMKNIYQNIGNDENNKSVRLIKQQLFLLKEGFEKVLKSLSKQIQYHQQKYIKALFSQKSQHINRDFPQSTNLLNASRSIVSSRPSKQARFQTTSQQFIFERKPSSSSSNLRQSCVQNQPQNSSLPNKLKLIKDKMGIVQFQNKKYILRIESLQTQNKTLKQKINQLQNNINQMTDKINKVKQIEDFYNYKIKKLKEELQVAHIVKQQNLAQKMRYILHNQ